MQISTRDHDYLIDTLKLRNDLQILNDSFTNPKILKVSIFIRTQVADNTNQLISPYYTWAKYNVHI